ncbi:hypothetical protein WG66_008820 [Moniliophthora roreri]|nr:hypothetical protein WG66_008820 [Moniliophthora roreri]
MSRDSNNIFPSNFADSAQGDAAKTAYSFSTSISFHDELPSGRQPISIDGERRVRS